MITNLLFIYLYMYIVFLMFCLHVFTKNWFLGGIFGRHPDENSPAEF